MISVEEALEKILQEGKNVVLVAEDIEGEAPATLW